MDTWNKQVIFLDARISNLSVKWFNGMKMSVNWIGWNENWFDRNENSCKLV